MSYGLQYSGNLIAYILELRLLFDGSVTLVPKTIQLHQTMFLLFQLLRAELTFVPP